MANLAQQMCSDLSDCSTLECACEPWWNYRCVTRNWCLTYTSPIQNPITFVFWHFSMIFKVFEAQWDLSERLSKQVWSERTSPLHCTRSVCWIDNCSHWFIAQYPQGSNLTKAVDAVSNLVQLPTETELIVLAIFTTALYMRMLSCCLYEEILRTNPAADPH